jgi:hypothetical protein
MARYGILLSKHADCNDTNNSCQVGTIPRCDAAGYCTLDGELTCVNETCTRDGYYLYYVARIATSRQVLLWTKLPANHPGMNSTIIFEHLSSITSHFYFQAAELIGIEASNAPFLDAIGNPLPVVAAPTFLQLSPSQPVLPVPYSAEVTGIRVLGCMDVEFFCFPTLVFFGSPRSPAKSIAFELQHDMAWLTWQIPEDSFRAINLQILSHANEPVDLLVSQASSPPLPPSFYSLPPNLA